MPDLIDIEPRYVDDRNLEGWERLIAWFFEQHVFTRLVPSYGQVVEMGVARGINFARLCEQFGPSRCEGFDVVNYPGHPRVRTVDVRTLDERDDRPIALAWNDLSNWEQSPVSKRAGFDFLTRNLVEEGLYIDADFEPDTLDTLDLTGLELVADSKIIKMWRRVGSSVEVPVEELEPGEPPLAWWQWLDRQQRLRPLPTRLGIPGSEEIREGSDVARWIREPTADAPAALTRSLQSVERNLATVEGFGQGFTRQWWSAGPCGSAAHPRLVQHLGPGPREVQVDGDPWVLEPGQLMFLPAGHEATTTHRGLSAIAVPCPTDRPHDAERSPEPGARPEAQESE